MVRPIELYPDPVLQQPTEAVAVCGILFFSRVSTLKRGLMLRRIRKLIKAGERRNDFVAE